MHSEVITKSGFCLLLAALPVIRIIVRWGRGGAANKIKECECQVLVWSCGCECATSREFGPDQVLGGRPSVSTVVVDFSGRSGTIRGRFCHQWA